MISNNKFDRELQKLTKTMAEIGPFIEGSLSVTLRMCGSKNCPCQRGHKHSAMYLTWKEERKTRSLYVPVSRQKEALAMSENYKKLKTIIRKISEINKMILTSKPT